jgi:hypothetical protein
MTCVANAEPIVIPTRFRGPPNSANGGYACGIVAEALGGDVEVTLRAPPPLDRPISLVTRGEREIELWNGGVRLARGRRQPLDSMPPPPRPSWEEACKASRHYAGFGHHPFPGCFVCGPLRAEGDGLRIFPGALSGRRVAAPWIPDESLCDRDGRVRPRFLWAALDCPGYFAVTGDTLQNLLLGRMAARLLRPVQAGEPCVIVGWPLASDGRKHSCGTALFSESAGLCGESQATWIAVRSPADRSEE